ncbi:MAG: amidohydrolase family protein, partial [Planctomycetes bacterium]|nr:amidohydrolase family protein [Planctomycetota bacterium]
GAQVAFGTDWPVVGLDPRPGLHVAMTRQTLSGEPPEGFVPSQRLNLQSAMRAYTEGSAYAEMEEKEKGTIKPGLLADLVVWDRDLEAVPTNEVHQVAVSTTIFDGKIVYRSSP